MLPAYLSRSFRHIFKIASDQPICFSWLQPNSVYDIASPSCPPSRTTPAASPTSGDNTVAATVAFYSSPTMATELPSQTVAGTSSALVRVAKPVQTDSSLARAVSPPTGAVASVSTHSDR